MVTSRPKAGGQSSWWCSCSRVKSFLSWWRSWVRWGKSSSLPLRKRAAPISMLPKTARLARVEAGVEDGAGMDRVGAAGAAGFAADAEPDGGGVEEGVLLAELDEAQDLG